MKMETVAGGLFAWGSGVAAAGAGAIAHADRPASAFFLILSGVCAMIGAIYYRAAEKESAIEDVLISVVGAFIIGVSIGPFAGAGLFAIAIAMISQIAPAFDGAWQTPFAEAVVGGLGVGAIGTPALRAIANRIRRAGGGDE